MLQRAVVLDCGSGWTKAGFAGDDVPRALLPHGGGGKGADDVLVGRLAGPALAVNDDDVPSSSPPQQLWQCPVEHGVVVNWAALEQVWRHVFTTELRLETPHDHPVLLAEYPSRTSHTREQAAQLMFETFGVPAFAVAAQSALSLFAAGRLTGVALSSGEGVTYAESVKEGLAMPGSTSTLHLAGRELTDHLAGMLDASSTTTAQGERAGAPHQPAAFSSHDRPCLGFSLAERHRCRREVARGIKEKLCYVLLRDYGHDRDQQATAAAAPSEYVLLDGRTIGVTSQQRLECLEALFNPALAGCEQDGIHATLYAAIMKSPMEIRNDLYANVVLAGGTTLAAGFVQRLRREVHGLMPSGLRLGVVADPRRRFMEWRGGVVSASCTTIVISPCLWCDE